jgi:hypothetical protein
MSATNQHDKYILWNGITTCIQSMNTTLASGSILAKLNAVGNMSLMLYNYLGRDACGQAGGAAYSYYKGGNIKNNPQGHGGHANSMIIGATFIESAVSYLPLSGKLMFAPLVVANVGKNIGWIGAGAVNTHYMSNISKDNIAEMYTRMSVANSFGATIGTMAGLGLTRYTIGNPVLGLGLCTILCIANKLSYTHLLSIANTREIMSV